MKQISIITLFLVFGCTYTKNNNKKPIELKSDKSLMNHVSRVWKLSRIRCFIITDNGNITTTNSLLCNSVTPHNSDYFLDFKEDASLCMGNRKIADWKIDGRNIIVVGSGISEGLPFDLNTKYYLDFANQHTMQLSSYYGKGNLDKIRFEYVFLDSISYSKAKEIESDL